jgi:deoxyribonuclease V
MKPARTHPWDLTPKEAIAFQRQVGLGEPLGAPPAMESLRRVLGVDVAYVREKKRSYAAAVLFQYPSLDVIEESGASMPTCYPYVPGLLSFREIPALIEALAQLKPVPDVILADGQGYAHMRRFGLARHLGWLYDIPSVGCAKTRLIGQFDPPGPLAGEYSDLFDQDAKIGEVLRTRTNVKPLFISPGHKMDFETARTITLTCCRGRRMPEPTRLAHHLTTKLMRQDCSS